MQLLLIRHQSCQYGDCSKDISFANMGGAALTSHMKGKKHIERSPSDHSIKSLTQPTPAPILQLQHQKVYENAQMNQGSKNQLIRC